MFAKYENFFQEPIKEFKVYAQDLLNVVKHHVEFPIGSSRFLSIVNLLVRRRFYYYYIITYKRYRFDIDGLEPSHTTKQKAKNCWARFPRGLRGYAFSFLLRLNDRDEHILL